MDEPTGHLEASPQQSVTMAASIPDGVLVGTSNDTPDTNAEQGSRDLSIGVVEENETLAKDNTLEKGPDGLQDQPLVLETGDNLISLEERLPLPPQLVEMWTRIDSTLDNTTTARVIQETYMAYDVFQPPTAQPWTRPESNTTNDNTNPNNNNTTSAAVSTTAVEKVRIAHDGHIPAAWLPAAQCLAHGRKWLAIGAQQREEEAARARAAEAAEQERAARRQAQRAQQAAASMALEAKGAERRAKEAAAAADRAAVAARRAASGATAAQRKARKVLVAWESGEPPREEAREGGGEAGEKDKEKKEKKPRAKATAKPKTAPGAAPKPRGRKRKIQEASS